MSDLPPAPRRIGIGGTVLWAALILSLAVNAFMIGGMLRHVGPFAGNRSSGGWAELMPNPRTFYREVSPETRDAIRKSLKGRRGEMQQNFKTMIASRQAELDALRVNPFDPEAYRRALEHSAEIDNAARHQAIDFFVKAAMQMKPEERKAVADRIDERMKNWGRRGKGRRDRDRDGDRDREPAPEAGEIQPAPAETAPSTPAP